MYRIHAFACFAALVGSGLYLASISATAQGPTPLPSVWLQNASPGTPQSGNLNVTGTATAGTFIGSGSGLSGIPWASVSGAPSSFPPNGAAGGDLSGTYPNPSLGLSVVNTGQIANLAVTNGKIADVAWSKITGAPAALPPALPFDGGANASTGPAFGVVNTYTGAQSIGILGRSDGPSGRGVRGFTSFSGEGGNEGGGPGLSRGVEGESASSDGIGVYGIASNGTGGNQGGYFLSNGPTGVGVYGETTSSTGVSYGGYFKSNSNSGYGIYAAAPATGFGLSYGVYATNAANGGGAAVAGISTSSTLTGYGGFFTSASPGGVGLFASGGGIGASFEASGGLGIGVNGKATSATGTTYAGKFDNASTGGYGVYASTVGPYGVYGTTTGSSGVAGFSTKISGLAYGGFFRADSSEGIGVRGLAFSSTGVNYGGKFDSNSSQGYGVYAESDGPAGVYGYGVGNGGVFESNLTVGVRGEVVGSPTVLVGYGVLGYDPANGYGYGVFSQGVLGASGSKAFRIDHPADPLNKYLLHYSSESPFPQNFYSGNVTTDTNGFAWISLPDYFEEINTDYKYQLTTVGKTFAQAVVWEEIANNRFQIRTSEPRVKVSWRVEANRNDAFVRHYPQRDVVDKLGVEKGVYQRPELYGAPKEMSLRHHTRPKR